MGLLNENGGEYFLANEVKVDVLKDFLKVGKFIVPRFIFYAVFFSVISGFLGVYTVTRLSSGLDYLFVGLLYFATVLFWYEAIRAWTKGPV